MIWQIQHCSSGFSAQVFDIQKSRLFMCMYSQRSQHFGMELNFKLVLFLFRTGGLRWGKDILILKTQALSS
jgi:hypothetical protein